jgi:hypothetical protein
MPGMSTRLLLQLAFKRPDDVDPNFNWRRQRIRCIGHIINLAVKAFLLRKSFSLRFGSVDRHSLQSLRDGVLHSDLGARRHHVDHF